MNTLLRLSSAIDAVTERVRIFIIVIVVATILAGFINAVLRYVGSAIQATLISNQLIQTQWYLFSLLFLLGFGYILKHDVNVRVDFLYSKWSPRRRALIDFLGTLLILIPFCLLGLYVTWGPVMTSFGRLPDGTWSGEWEVSADAGGLPIAPLKAMILVGFTLLLLQAVAQLFKYLAVVTGHAVVNAAPEKAEDL